MKHLVLSLLALSIITYASAQSIYNSPIFGDQGFREYPVWSGNAGGHDAVLRDDGYLLVAGTGYWSACNCFHITMAMVDTTCGALDPEFGNGGVQDVVFEGRSSCHDVFIQANDKIVACGVTAPGNGFSGHKAAVYRLNADGTPDPTFNGLGYHKALFDPVSSGAFWQAFPLSNGGVACVGVSTSNINGGTNAIGAMRFLADGTLDASFNGDGITAINLSALSMSSDYDLGTGLMLSDSSLIAIGLITAAGQQTIGLAKFLQDGTPDLTFGTNGLAVSSVIGASNVETAGMNAAVDANGRILVSGTRDFTNGEFLMARFLANGSLDPTYGTGGESVVTIADNALGRRMELLPDGSTLQYGSQNWNNGLPRIVKRMPDGTLDVTFGNNGVAAPFGPTFHKVYGGMTLPSGRILAWGTQSEISVFGFTSDPASEEFLDLGADLTGCQGDSVQLDAGGPYTSYAWSTTHSTQTIWASEPGDYIVMVVDERECRDTDTVSVSLSAPPDQPMITSMNGVDLNTTSLGVLQWFLNGVAIPGAIDQDLGTVENGDYTVQVTDEAGCTALSDLFTVTTVGLPEQSFANVAVYPNPSDGLFRVEVPAIAGPFQLTLLDALGRNCEASWDTKGYLDAQHLSAGSYVLVIMTRDGKRAVQQLAIR